MRLLFTILVLLFQLTYADAQDMSADSLVKIIRTVSEGLDGNEGFTQFEFKDRFMFAIVDESYNRMRIISPISEIKNISAEQFFACMEANFHTALDVKYAVSEEIMWSVFVHPLKELKETQIVDAISQVYNAAESFGTSYSSTLLAFPSQDNEHPDAPKEKITKL